MSLPLSDPLGSNRNTCPANMSRRELATTLAALRLWQRTWAADARPSQVPEWEVATQDGNLRAMDPDEIELLCTRLALRYQGNI